MAELHNIDVWLKGLKLSDLDKEDMLELKKKGFSDAQIARAVGKSGVYDQSMVHGTTDMPVSMTHHAQEGCRRVGRPCTSVWVLCTIH